MMNRPIVPLEIRRVFQGRIFAVNVESITLPRGERLDAEIVRHPGSAVLIPVTDAGAIILVRQYRHAVKEDVWELPAGRLAPGETPEEAVQRELQEEIGFKAETLEKVAFFYTTPGFCDETMHVFRATGLTPSRFEADEDERIETAAFTVAEARSMIHRGLLREGKTLVAVLLEIERRAARPGA